MALALLVSWQFRKVSEMLLYLAKLTIDISADKEYNDSEEFRCFRRDVFHESLRLILASLKPGMTTPEIVRYADGHYRRTIYGLGPYIADYPEQVLITCIVQGWCPR
jgi:hypothetical protein